MIVLEGECQIKSFAGTIYLCSDRLATAADAKRAWADGCMGRQQARGRSAQAEPLLAYRNQPKGCNTQHRRGRSITWRSPRA